MNNDFKIETFLGNDIRKAGDQMKCRFVNLNFESNDPNIEIYGSRDFLKEYHGIHSRHITLKTNNELIQSITVHFNEVIDIQFYNSFKDQYGSPKSILVKHNLRLIDEGINENNGLEQYVSKREFDLKEGTFEEKPLYIIWETENYQIKAFLRHEHNISEITFSKN